MRDWLESETGYAGRSKRVSQCPPDDPARLGDAGDVAAIELVATRMRRQQTAKPTNVLRLTMNPTA